MARLRNVLKGVEMSDQSKGESADDGEDASLDRDLKALFKAVQSEPVSDEIKRLAQQLESRLKNLDKD